MNTFDEEMRKNIGKIRRNPDLRKKSLEWIISTSPYKYVYNYKWLNRPIIQFPQDMVAMQELIWKVKPDLIIEAGIAHGGSLILSASMLTMLDYSEAVKRGVMLDPHATRRRVLGIDIDIRLHNRLAIEKHPLSHRIDMIQGSSIAPEVIAQVYKHVKNFKRVLVCLDSDHTHDHVLTELEAYAPLVSKDSYCVVSDTSLEDMPDKLSQNRPWGKGNNPKTAVWEYLGCLKKEGRKANDGKPLVLEVDEAIENKLLITGSWGGYLKRIR